GGGGKEKKKKKKKKSLVEQLHQVPLTMCLHTYCTSEDLVHTERYHCDRCNAKVEAKKRLAISRLPEILMVHIKRFSHSSYWSDSSKVSTQVDFPINDFDVGEYLHRDYADDPCNEDTMYDLCSLVKHIGGTGGGHYIAFAKHPLFGHWSKFDDNWVERISPDIIAQQQAYILFYVRRRQNTRMLFDIQKLLHSNNDHVHTNNNTTDNNNHVNTNTNANNANVSDSNHTNDKTANSLSSKDEVVQLSRYWFHKA
ncbi:peptidase C19 family protein, partial [Reticulomyxa filosa]